MRSLCICVNYPTAADVNFVLGLVIVIEMFLYVAFSHL